MMINGTISSTIISLDQTMSIISISFANVVIYLLISTSDKIKGSRQERCWSVTPTIFYFFPLWYPVGTQRVSWGFAYIYIYIWQLLQFLQCKALGGIHYGNGAHAQAPCSAWPHRPLFLLKTHPLGLYPTLNHALDMHFFQGYLKVHLVNLRQLPARCSYDLWSPST